jgi:hypothetical protein
VRKDTQNGVQSGYGKKEHAHERIGKWRSQGIHNGREETGKDSNMKAEISIDGTDMRVARDIGNRYIC